MGTKLADSVQLIESENGKNINNNFQGELATCVRACETKKKSSMNKTFLRQSNYLQLQILSDGHT